MFYLLRNIPARGDNFTTVTGSTLFPLKFCGIIWLEDVPVAESTADMEPHFQICYDNSSSSKVQSPEDTVIQQCYAGVAHTSKPSLLCMYCKDSILFLPKFQTGEPMAIF